MTVTPELIERLAYALGLSVQEAAQLCGQLQGIPDRRTAMDTPVSGLKPAQVGTAWSLVNSSTQQSEEIKTEDGPNPFLTEAVYEDNQAQTPIEMVKSWCNCDTEAQAQAYMAELKSIKKNDHMAVDMLAMQWGVPAGVVGKLLKEVQR